MTDGPAEALRGRTKMKLVSLRQLEGYDMLLRQQPAQTWQWGSSGTWRGQKRLWAAGREMEGGTFKLKDFKVACEREYENR